MNDLLDFFLMKNGKFHINLHLTSPIKPVTDLLDMFSVAAIEKNIRLSHFFHEGIPESLCIDEQRIKQVLINLISNSLKFTVRGEICIVVAYDKLQRMLHFSVKDTGIGIKEEERAKLFTLFGKLESSS